MNKNNGSDRSQKTKTQERIDEIEQMYRDADLYHAASLETDTLGQPRLPVSKISTSPDSEAEIVDPGRPHWWLLDVLEDMACYAENEEMPELQEYIQDVKFRVAEILHLIEQSAESDRRSEWRL